MDVYGRIRPVHHHDRYRLALYALYEPRHWFYHWFMPLNDLIGVPTVCLIHLIGMWCFIIFAMIHVYLSILSGNVDRDGTISSMFSAAAGYARE